MNYLVLLRHGQSQWNLEKRFTGHQDVDLTPQGEAEAARAGQLLRAISFDKVFTSTLQRAYRTAEFATEGRGAAQVRLDDLRERNYGELTGHGKDDMRAKYGAEQVRLWRLSWEAAPPGGESLQDVHARVGRVFRAEIEPLVRAGKNILMAAHEHPLRAMLILLGEHTPETIQSVELPTGVPLVFEYANGAKGKNYFLK